MFKSVIRLLLKSQYPYNSAIATTRSLQLYQQLNSTLPKKNFNQRRETEQEYLYKIQNDADVFGSPLVETTPISVPEDIKEMTYIENPKPKRLSTKQYADIIKDYIRKKKIKEAIDVLEIKMIKEDGVKPEGYIYNLLIGACGTVGYTKKAFMLFNDMKKRQEKVHPGTVTALFNACANSPWPDSDGLTRAKNLRSLLQEQQFELNKTNYNAMIKAFGRCGDMQTAFNIVDEMVENCLKIEADTLNFLLQACISDKEAGFRHALLVWRQFIKKNIAPNVFSYNLLLRCTRDCNVGNLQAIENIINKITEPQTLQIKAGEDCAKENETALINPNLLAKNAHMGSVIELKKIVTACDRLLLLGGLNGFLQNMSENKVEPNVKTFTQLLDSIPSSEAMELELMKHMKKNKIKFDVDFYNMLMKRRCLREDYEAAKNVIPLMDKKTLKPNLLTFGLLAMTCRSRSEADFLLVSLRENGFRPNIEILGTLLNNACFKCDFSYVLYIMELILKENIPPNKIFLEHLEDFKKKCKRISNEDNTKENFMRHFKIFRLRYKTWLESVKDSVDRSDEEHPWKQFRETSDTVVKSVKDDKSKFKPIHKSRYRQKTSSKSKNKYK